MDELVSEDPKKICDYINTIRVNEGIDYIKVKFRVPVPGYNKTIISNYYRNNPTTFVEFLAQEEIEKKKQELELANTKYDYLIDNSISDLDRFVRYVNESEGCEFITVQKLTELLNDKII